MNIVVLSDTASINGGAAKIALDGASAMARAGHQVHLVCGTGPVAQELESVPNLTVHCIGKYDILIDPNRLRAAAYGLWNPRSRRYVGELLDGLDRENTIVHVHSWTKALSSSAVSAALERKFRTVFTLHDFLLACPTGTLFLQNTQEKCTLRPMGVECVCTNCDVRSYPDKLWRIGRWVVQNGLAGIPAEVQHFIYYSQLSLDILRPSLPSDANFYCVPNSIEIDCDSAADIATNQTFIFMGRITREKGAELFARAALAEKVPCLFIGEGAAKQEVARANPDAVFSGWVNHRDGIKALRGGRALVFPSLWYETLGLVVLEAAGNGVPSIVPDSSAARESVIDGVTGLHFRSGDEGDLRAKIAMMKEPGLARSLGQAAYKRFWDPPGWSLELHRQRLEAIYRRMLAISRN